MRGCDRSPPIKPVIDDISRVTGEVSQLVLIYEGEGDGTDGSGLKEVRLWYRHSDDKEWVRTERANTAPRGEIYFTEPSKPGLYFFDLVAVDQAGNESAKPAGTDGQKRFRFQNRAQIEKATANAGQSQLPDVEGVLSSAAPPPGWMHVPVYFHLISQDVLTDASRLQIAEQISVLNRAFSSGKIAFSIAGADTNPNPSWSDLYFGSPSENDMKVALAISTESQLNVYVTETRNGILSWSTFPWELAADPNLDGCVIRPDTLPGGVPPFDEGKTLVHCVGHWLGLYHTFQGGCAGPGDYVADTPAHNLASFGIPKEEGACKAGEFTPIANYMNYADDSLQKEFTSGQYLRMRKAVAAYRTALL